MQNILSSSFLFKIKIYGSIILSFVLYGCEKWSLTFTEIRSLWLFGNSTMNSIFGPKKADLTRERIQLDNLEINVLKFRPNIVGVMKSRRMRWAGHVAGMGEGKYLQVFGG